MTQQYGRFQMLKRIATGGMAEIFIAKQRGVGGFEKLVVIKKLLPELTGKQKFTQMFLNEAKIASRLSHPNVVQIYDLGFAEGNYFIAMEYIQGENLRSLLRTCKKQRREIPLAYVLKIISQACEGLHHAHTKNDVFGKPLNIIHCDISPQNILVSFEGVVKVVDFGIAKAASLVEEILPDQVKGKLAYMSPEQCQGQSVTTSSDLFSLGIVFWELLTLRRLFGRYTSAADVVQAIVYGDIPSPRSDRPAVPAEIEAIVLKMLERQSARRFPSALDIHRALEDFMTSAGMTLNTFDVGSFIQQVFQDKLDPMRKIEEAQCTGQSLESILFDDIRFDESETQSESSPVTPSAPQPAPKPAEAKAPKKNKAGLTILLVILVAALASVLGFFLPRLLNLLVGDDAVTTEIRPEPPKGVLRITSEPSGAQVMVNQKVIGSTPSEIKGLKLGVQYQIEVSAPGFKAWRTNLTVENPVQVPSLHAVLTRLD